MRNQLSHADLSKSMRILRSARTRSEALTRGRDWLEAKLADVPFALYEKTTAALEPVSVLRLEAAPSFRCGGSLERALHATAGPMMTRRSHRARRLADRLDSAERDALDAVGAIALFPLSLARDHEVFVLIGGSLAEFDADRLARTLAPVADTLLEADRTAPVLPRSAPVSHRPSAA